MGAHYLITHNTQDQGAGCRLLYFIAFQNSVHLKDFQPLGISLGHDKYNLVCK